MDLELIFTIANNSPMPAWLLLVFAPNWRWTQRIVHSILMPVLLGLAYALLLFTDFGGGGDGNFFSLAGVMALFDKPQTVIAAWIHYLVFDLFVGAWQVRDAKRRGIRHLYVVPCLISTLMFGPFGLLLYLTLRAFLKRATTLDESEVEQPSAAEPSGA